jgi:hypothetical protein
MEGVATDPPLSEHFVLLVATFRGSSDPPRGADGARWQPASRGGASDAAAARDDADFFQPYARRLLFPDSAGGDASRESVVRLVASPEAIESLAAVTLVPQHEESPTPVAVRKLEALLFPTGVGFFVAKLQVATATPTLGELTRANRQLRVLRPPSRTWQLAKLRTSGGETTVRGWIEEQLGGLGRLVDADRAQLVTFACLDRAVVDAQDAGSFADPTERLLYEVGAGLRAGATLDEPTWVPGRDQIDELRRANTFEPWRSWRMLALRETLTFLATDALPFTTRAFPRVIEGSYLPLYLYVLHQQIMLAGFADDLVARVAEGQWDLYAIRRHTEAFVDFRHRYWFAEVTRKPLGGDLYRRFQNGLGVVASYELASRAVSDVRAFHEDRRARQITLLLHSMTFFFGPFGVSMGIAGLIVPEGASRSVRAGVVFGLVVLAWIVLWGLWQGTRMAERRR